MPRTRQGWRESAALAPSAQRNAKMPTIVPASSGARARLSFSSDFGARAAEGMR
jgi:hypothetical protein